MRGIIKHHNATTEPKRVCTGRDDRLFMAIHNRSTTRSVYMSFTPGLLAGDVDDAWEIAAGTQLFLDAGITNEVYLFTTASTAQCQVMEGVKGAES